MADDTDQTPETPDPTPEPPAPTKAETEGPPPWLSDFKASLVETLLSDEDAEAPEWASTLGEQLTSLTSAVEKSVKPTKDKPKPPKSEPTSEPLVKRGWLDRLLFGNG